MFSLSHPCALTWGLGQPLSALASHVRTCVNPIVPSPSLYWLLVFSPQKRLKLLEVVLFTQGPDLSSSLCSGLEDKAAWGTQEAELQGLSSMLPQHLFWTTVNGQHRLPRLQMAIWRPIVSLVSEHLRKELQGGGGADIVPLSWTERCWSWMKAKHIKFADLFSEGQVRWEALFGRPCRVNLALWAASALGGHSPQA